MQDFFDRQGHGRRLFVLNKNKLQTDPEPVVNKRGESMSIVYFEGSHSKPDDPAPVGTPRQGDPLHQIAAVRKRQGISCRALARRLKTEVGFVKWQEQADSDMLLSTLYQWQKALGVPVTELLVDDNEPLSPPVMKRARMVRLMKTAMAIREEAQAPPLKRMAQMLVEQLIEIMPELKDVNPWNAVGQRRTLDELGQAADRRLSLDALADLME